MEASRKLAKAQAARIAPQGPGGYAKKEPGIPGQIVDKPILGWLGGAWAPPNGTVSPGYAGGGRCAHAGAAHRFNLWQKFNHRFEIGD